ncbi:MAG: 3-mercaptopyruvate sulfurtransferase [Hyphomicrobiales bacterium]
MVSTEWLAGRLGDPGVVIIDASWHLPAGGRDAHGEFVAERIPNARFFDIDAISDTETILPHMLPSAEKFASSAGRLGIGDGTRVICYDTAGLFSAARAWWMFRVFGHDEVAILDGGFANWKAERRPIERGPPPHEPEEQHFTARFRPDMVRGKREMQNETAKGAVIADARSPGRFRGEEPEPRKEVRAGHIPGARNVHYATLLNPDGTLKPAADIARAFAEAGVDISRPVITSCGSGVTAAILTLGLTLLGAKEHALYDGSWTEWGSDPDLPAATGA